MKISMKSQGTQINDTANNKTNSFPETIEFFRKLILGAERSLEIAKSRNRKTDAENIRKKIVHYQRAIEALEKAKE